MLKRKGSNRKRIREHSVYWYELDIGYKLYFIQFLSTMLMYTFNNSI